MRITRTQATNLRMFPEVDVSWPAGFTIVQGDNDSGKTTLATLAPRWCIWGPDAIPVNQDTIVREGERDLAVTVWIESDGQTFEISRRFLLNTSGRGGVSTLKLKAILDGDGDEYDLTESKIDETQAQIIERFGTYRMWKTTAYVDQEDGPGDFMKLGGADKQGVLHDIINVAADWDRYHKDAQDTLKELEAGILADEGRHTTLAEQAAALAGAREAEDSARLTRDGVQLVVNTRDTADAEANDVVIGMLETKTVYDTAQAALDRAEQGVVDAVARSEQAQEAVTATEALLGEGEAIKTAYTAQNDEQREYEESLTKWQTHVEEIANLNRIASENYSTASQDWRAKVKALRDKHEAHRKRVEEGEVCPTCHRPGMNVEAMPPEPEYPEAPADAVMNRPSVSPDRPFQKQEIIDRHAQLRAAQDNYLLFKAASSKSEKDVLEASEYFNSLDDSADPPDEEKLNDARQASATANASLGEARRDLQVAERTLGTAEGAVTASQQAQTDADALAENLTKSRESITRWELTVEGFGPAGARQLMLDQALRELETVANDVLDKLMPGFKIYFGTQAVSGRETIEDAVMIPAGGLKPWRALGGAAGDNVAIAVRLALIELLRRHTGVWYEHLILDEPDKSMRGEREDEFLKLLARVTESGMTVTTISHKAEAMDIPGAQVILTSSPDGTKVSMG